MKSSELQLLETELNKLSSDELKDVITNTFSAFIHESNYYAARNEDQHMILSGQLRYAASRLRNEVLIMSQKKQLYE